MQDREALKKFLAERDKIKQNQPNRGGGEDLRFWRPSPDGESKARFLPAINSPIPGKMVYRHKNLPGEKDKLPCFRHYGQECPICDLLDKYRGRLDDVIEKWEWNDMSVCHVLPLSPSTVDGKPIEKGKAYLMASGGFNLEWLVQQMDNDDVGDITDPKTGSPVTFKRKRTNGALERTPGRMSVPIADSDEKIQEILATRQDPDKIWKAPTDQDYIKAKEIAQELEKMIEARLMTLVQENKDKDTPPPNTVNDKLREQEQQNREEKTQPVEEKKEDPKPPKVDGKPECFGDKGKYDPAADVCLVCHSEIECGEFITKGQ